MRSLLAPLVVLALTSGCLGDDAADPPDAATQVPPPTPEPLVTPLLAEGASEGVTCAPVGCRVFEPSRDVMLPAQTPLRRIEATVTWTPRDPSLTQLEVFLLRITEDGWEWEESPDTYWVGGSPLAINASVTDETPQEYVIHARAVHQPAAGFEAGLSQTYRIEGTVWAAPAP